MLSLALSAFIRDFTELVHQEHEQVGAEFEHLDECHESKAEPQTEHSAEIRYVLYRLHTYTIIDNAPICIRIYYILLPSRFELIRFD